MALMRVSPGKWFHSSLQGCSRDATCMAAPPFGAEDGWRATKFIPEMQMGFWGGLSSAGVALLVYWAALVPPIVVS
jgi:hypothetical protein